MSDTIVIQTTDDGVPTLYLPGLDEHYHSTKGALTEARHVYIDMALRARDKTQYRPARGGIWHRPECLAHPARGPGARIAHPLHRI